MAQLVEYLPSKHEDPGLIPNTHLKARHGSKYLKSQFCGGRDKRIHEVCWPASLIKSSGCRFS